MRDTSTSQMLRWFLVLPGAMLAGILVLFPVHWLAMFIVTTKYGKSLLAALPLESLEIYLDALFVPGTIICTGARIAPRFRFATGILVALLIALLIAGLIVFQFAKLSSIGTHMVDSPFTIVKVVLWLSSIAFALFHARALDKASRPGGKVAN